MRNRKIKIALDRISNEVLNLDHLNGTKEGFNLREKYNRDLVELECLECGQPLVVSFSSKDRVYFRHEPGHDHCILTDDAVSKEEISIFEAIHASKESPRHKELKLKIGALLNTVPGVDKESIAIDNAFIFFKGAKRRPDVFCAYRDKRLVFEIQLSNLSQRYILSRSDFYRAAGIYLIWILDDLDVRNPGGFKRDIKYLSSHQNYFRLAKSSQDSWFECEYKRACLTDTVKTQWTKCSITLDKLQFDRKRFEVFYYDLEKEIRELERKLVQRKIETARHLAEEKVESIIKEIKWRKDNQKITFSPVDNRIDTLDDVGCEILNSELNLVNQAKNGVPALIHWIDEVCDGYTAFLDFILSQVKIDLDVQVCTDEGRSGFEAINKSEQFNEYVKERFTRHLFRRGYVLNPRDFQLCTELRGLSEAWRHRVDVYYIMNKVRDRRLIPLVMKYEKVIFIIESARARLIVGSKLPNWVAFANNVIQNYTDYWPWIDDEFQKNGLWKVIIDSDSKGTVKRKLSQPGLSKNKNRTSSFEQIYRDLYTQPPTT